MKSIRNIAFSALLTIGAFTAITYTSCNKDECKDVVCNNGGTCDANTGACVCATGYEGATCDTKSRDKFVGIYVGTETCTIGTDNYSITLAANSDALKLTLTNLYNDTQSPITAICTMTGTNSFSFNGTHNGATYTGTGTLGGNKLTVQYTITDGAISNTCTFIGDK
jgi:hypothetical protein